MSPEEFHALPTVASAFPLLYANGARWSHFTGQCARCASAIAPALTRGSVTHPYPRVYVLDALGYCPLCRLLTPFQYRLHDDMSMTGKKDGEWRRWAGRPSALVRVWRALVKVLTP